MTDIKEESPAAALEEAYIKVENGENMETKEWDAGMELALLNAIARCKPVGIHKHFRIISVQKQFNQNSPVSCTVKEIWQRLGDFYGMSALDELEEEDEEQEEEEREEQEKRKGDSLHEFSLPLEDYEQLISEHRQDNHSVSSTSLSPVILPVKRTRTSKRESSPATSVAESVASTPEPEEGKSSRRSRGTRKSTPEPRRRTGRSSSATRGKRQTKRK
ncbi:CT20-domain-containing protein [Backusella circina FSU 941]|nr:CT20-domain-containing protein [Backusella circina FSU 941]